MCHLIQLFSLKKTDLFLDDFGNNVAPVASMTEKQQFVKIPTFTSAKSELRDIKGNESSNTAIPRPTRIVLRITTLISISRCNY